MWKAERFSWQLTKLMHRFPEDGPFERRMQLAELDYIAASAAAQTAIAENYVGPAALGHVPVSSKARPSFHARPCPANAREG